MNTEPPQAKRWKTIFSLLMAFGCGAAFFAVNYWMLAATHPADDAYILYRYVDHAAAGHGIVFNLGGVRAEGATDFLWFLLLVVLVKLGVDVAIGAAVLNSLGAAIAGWILGGLCWGGSNRSNAIRASLCATLPTILVAGGALSGYWGFSTMLYSGLTLLLFATSIQAKGRALAAIPILASVLALYRPDGVVVGAAFVAIGLWFAWSAGVFRRYVVTTASCGIVGLAYFAWRWSYFGLLLPLPLYVKQHEHSSAYLPGLADHRRWLMDAQGPLLILIVLAVLLIYSKFWRDQGTTRLGVFLLPPAALIVELAFAVQSQNVQWRFQAPVFLVFVYALLHVAGRLADQAKGTALRAAVLALTVAAVVRPIRTGVSEVRQQLGGRWTVYLETLAPRLGPQLDERTVIALTEAGVVPYWTKAHVFDIVGLNNPDTAIRPQPVSYVKGLHPDLVFFHHAGTLDRTQLVAPGTDAGRVVRISADHLQDAVRPTNRELMQRGVKTYDETGMRTTEYAAVLLTQFLIESTDYEILTVAFTEAQDYVHIYGIKNGWPGREKFLSELDAAMLRENYHSYLEAKRIAAAQ